MKWAAKRSFSFQRQRRKRLCHPSGRLPPFGFIGTHQWDFWWCIHLFNGQRPGVHWIAGCSGRQKSITRCAISASKTQAAPQSERDLERRPSDQVRRQSRDCWEAGAACRRLYAPGAMLVGDTASFLNAVRIKGIHLAMKSWNARWRHRL